MIKKKVYIEPAWKMHTFYRQLMSSSPEGYEFVALESGQEKLFKKASRLGASYAVMNGIEKIVPLNLTKAYLEKGRKIPKGSALTYSYDHIVFRKEPWVVDLEYISHLISYNVKQFRHYQKSVSKALSSDYCRKIICGTEAAKKTVLLNVNGTNLEDKVEIVPFATQGKNFTKKFNEKTVKILFVGSANIAGEFETKGGREALEAFAQLSQKYEGLQMVVRSDMPAGLKKKYTGMPGLKIIEDMLPWKELEREFQTADIFLMPVHNTPYSVFLDAMSYELPIVTIDSWANAEIIEDGKTGLLIPKSAKIPYYVENYIPSFGTSQFKKAISRPDPLVVANLVEKTSLLIENTEMRKKMGRAGRQEVEHGRFSIAERNKKLKRIFDEATA